MAWSILRSVRHSFTSTEPYLALLQNLGNHRTPIGILRICSNVPMENYRSEGASSSDADRHGAFTVGIFSNFSLELRTALEPAIGAILENPEISVALLGPGESFLKSLAGQFPQAADRIATTGRLHVTQIGKHMRSCHALLQLYPDGASAARGTLIAALASGIPVVTTAGPDTDRLLVESGAMLFSEGSPQSIRHAVELLRKTPGRAREIGVRALRLYAESFQPAVIVSAIREAMGGRKDIGDKELELEAALLNS
jgi:glycosyltransferase involved in cell wall biosynthesis